MKSLPGYFEHINRKTYLDRYPKKIIRFDELKDKVFIEFGAGSGNDIDWLLTQGFNPKDMFLIEIDDDACSQAMKNLNEEFGEYSSHILLRDARSSGLKNLFADFVYANNMLHCLETRDNIFLVLKEAFRILRDGGVLFGRTLLENVDKQKLEAISEPKNRKEKFALLTANALQDGILVGLTEREIKKMAKEVGFSRAYTEIKPWKWKPTTDFYFRFEK
jgi:SAM-dependent methyltransferase